MIPLIARETTTSSNLEGDERDTASNHEGFCFAETIALLDNTESPTSNGDLEPSESTVSISGPVENDGLPAARYSEEIGQDSTETTAVAAIGAHRKTADAVTPFVGKDGKEALLRFAPQQIDGEPVPSMGRMPTEKKSHHSDRTGVSPLPNSQSVVEGLFPITEQVKLPANVQMGAVSKVKGLIETQKYKDVIPRVDTASDISIKELRALTQELALLNTGRSDWLASSAKSIRTGDGEGNKVNSASSRDSTDVTSHFFQSRMVPSKLREGSNLTGIPGELISVAVPGERTYASVQIASNAPATQGSEVARQVAGQLAIAARPGQATEISLNPEDLGRVRMSMTSADATITLNIIAERPETTELLRRHIEMLTQEFKALGFEDVSFSFDSQNRPESDTETLGAESGVIGEIADDDTPRPVQETHQDSGLDLRL